ncbi:hypothetical protein M432DRAFT_672471 [Thermoascus aurantiacus ATCC 26904]
MPDFTWPDTNLNEPIATDTNGQMPPTPATHPALAPPLLGSIHWHLRSFSLHYCRWAGIPYDNQIAQLPFGLVLKWSDGTRIEEVLAMQRNIRNLRTHAPVSILVTRVPGRELGTVYQSLGEDDKEAIVRELKTYLGHDEAVGQSLGRKPDMFYLWDRDPQQFNEYLIRASWAGGFPSEAEYLDARQSSSRMAISSIIISWSM